MIRMSSAETIDRQYGKESALKLAANLTKRAQSLNYNHWLVVQLSGYLLHPNIPTLSSDYRVADIGAGTGYVSS